MRDIKRGTSLLKRKSTQKLRILQEKWHDLPLNWKLSIFISALVLTALGGTIYRQTHLYTVSGSETSILARGSVGVDSIKESENKISYNVQDDKAQRKKFTVGATGDTTSKIPYEVVLPKNISEGIVFGSSENDMNFKMTPAHQLSKGRLENGRVVYPENLNTKHVYTFKRNGIKEDILLKQAPGDTATYSWTLDLGDKLEARMIPGGAVGIFSADETLTGDITIADEKSRELLNKARAQGEKSRLLYVLPAPYIKDHTGNTNTKDVSYKLDNNTLTLEARNLENMQYPLSIDPTIVTTTAEFRAGSDDGLIDYSTTDQLTRADLSKGTVGTWTTTTSFATARNGHTSVAYNGYLYVIGGTDGTNRNDVQYAPINSDGTVGTWNTTSSFSTARNGHTSVAYNGYLYVIGGTDGTNRNDVQYAPINSDGTVGTWNTTSSFSTARSEHTSAVYNGYLYILGGTSGSNLNDVQYAVINANGTIGTWTSTTAFTTARSKHASVAYNGYIYVIGGTSGSNLNDVQYALLCTGGNNGVGGCTATAGTVGTWSTTASFPTARNDHTAIAAKGYLYILGGTTGSARNDMQYVAFNPNGTLTDWSSNTSFTTARYAQTTVAYNNYMYLLGGTSGTNQNDVQRTAFDVGAPVGGTWTDTMSVSSARAYHTSVAANGFLYVLGGTEGTTTVVDTVLYAAINSNGAVGSWTNTTAFPAVRSLHTSFTHNGYIYAIGGWDGTNDYNTTLYALLCTGSNNGVGGCGSTAGTVGTWNTTTNFRATGLRGMSGAIDANGYMYLTGGWNGTTTYTEVRSALICTGSNNGVGGCGSTAGTVGTWNTTTAFTTERRGHQTQIANGYIYVLGGQNASYLTDVRYALICTGSNNGVGGCNTTPGTVGNWSSTGTLLYANSYFGSTVKDGWLYVTGGWNGTDHYNATYVSLICTGSNSGVRGCGATAGTLGTWYTASAMNNGGRYGIALADYNGKMYMSAGYNAGSKDDVQFAIPTPDIPTGDTIDIWADTTAFTTARTYHSSVAYNGYLYIIGGGYSSTVLADTQYAKINSNGTVGTWTATSSMPVNRSLHASFVYNGYVYVMGGWDGTNNHKDGAYALICTGSNNGQQGCNATVGTLGTWTTLSDFHTVGTRALDGTVYDGYVYLVGGFDGTNMFDTVRYALICTGYNNGQGGCGSTAGSIGTWATTTSMTTVRRGHDVQAYNGFIYVMGGIDPAYRNDVMYARICTGNNNGVDGCGPTPGTIGTWVTTKPFNNARTYPGTFVYNGYLYIAGGWNGATRYADVQYALICTGNNSGAGGCNSTPGTLGTWNLSPSFSVGRFGPTAVGYNGYIYVAGGEGIRVVTAEAQNDVQYVNLRSTENAAHYEKIIDITGPLTINSITFNGKSVCSAKAQYRTAGSDGIFGTVTTLYNALPGITYTINEANKQYIWVKYIFDDSKCGSNSYLTDFTVGHNARPSAPTISTPLSTSTLPVFNLRTTDNESDYLRYNLVLYEGDCSTLIRNIDQTASQTGWSGQDQQTSTAYTGSNTLTSSTLAIHTYQTPALALESDFCVKARAKDPAGSNLWGAYSSNYTFSTNKRPAAPVLDSPANNETGTLVKPVFQLRSTDNVSDYLRYKIDICSNSDCSSILRTVDQTASQTGWAGMDAQNGTAYTSSSILANTHAAYYYYQFNDLVPNTQYWWRGYAIDPGGINQFSTASSISSFTTASQAVGIGGGVEIRGGTRISN